MSPASAPMFDFSPRTFWANSTPLNACRALSIVLGLHMLQVGLWIFYDPVACTKAFGLRYDGKSFNATSSTNLKDKAVKASSSPKSEAEDGNYWTHLFACREVGFGVLLLIFAALGEWRSVGVVVGIVAGLLATTDGVASAVYGKDGWNGAVKGHGIPAVVLGGVAVGVLVL